MYARDVTGMLHHINSAFATSSPCVMILICPECSWTESQDTHGTIVGGENRAKRFTTVKTAVSAITVTILRKKKEVVISQREAKWSRKSYAEWENEWDIAIPAIQDDQREYLEMCRCFTREHERYATHDERWYPDDDQCRRGWMYWSKRSKVLEYIKSMILCDEV